MARLVTFGETMIRMSVPLGKRLENTQTLDVTVGGSEMNVAVGASRLGVETAWVSRLPENGWGRHILNVCHTHGVNTSHIVWDCGGRCGVYFIETGAVPRPTQVLYDRADSAFANLKLGEVDWAAALGGAEVFLTSGITTAVCGLEVTMEAIEAARKAGAKVAFDLNYRAKLWSTDEAAAAYREILPHVNIVFASGSDALQFFPAVSGNMEELLETTVKEYGWEAATLIYGPHPTVASPWRVLACSQDGLVTDDRPISLQTVDRIGAGDAFAAGFLAGYLTEGIATGLQYGQAMLALKNTFTGDLSWATLDEVKSFVSGGGGALVR